VIFPGNHASSAQAKRNVISVTDNGPHTIKAMDVSGSIVFARSSTAAQDYDLNGIKCGIYFIVVELGENTYNRKILIY
jgi:hypothetical protein